jgi:hypothetical protein
VLLLSPTVTPFFFHTYNGVFPASIGVAVNVMEVPLQILLVDEDALMLTEVALGKMVSFNTCSTQSGSESFTMRTESPLYLVKLLVVPTRKPERYEPLSRSALL